MDITLSRARLLPALKLAASITGRAKQQGDLLKNVLLRTDGKRVLLAATDLVVTVTSEVDADAVRAPGAVMVDGGTFAEIVKAAPEDAIVIRQGENFHVHLSSGRAKHRIVGRAADDFPRLPSAREATWAKVPVADFRGMLAATAFAMTPAGDSRAHLDGVRFEVDAKGGASATATDGHRLSHAERGGFDCGALAMTIPRVGVKDIGGLLDGAEAAEMAHQGDYLFLRADGVVCAVKQVGMIFPPWEQVVPTEFALRAEFDRAHMESAVRRIMLSAGQNDGIKMTINHDAIAVSAECPEGTSTDEIAATATGPELAIGVNGKYLLDALGAIMHPRVVLQGNGDLDPIRVAGVDDGHAFGLMMPMHL